VEDRFEVATKALLDKLPLGEVKPLHNGGCVAFGYKPDRVYIVRRCTWVVELESSTSRKGYLGGYIKAQQYLHEKRNGRGALLFVVNETRCKSETIKRQLQHYHNWLYELGVPVQPTYLLYTNEVKALAERGVTLFSREFLKCAKVVRYRERA
jgi:hypothetical protein